MVVGESVDGWDADVDHDVDHDWGVEGEGESGDWGLVGEDALGGDLEWGVDAPLVGEARAGSVVLEPVVEGGLSPVVGETLDVLGDTGWGVDAPLVGETRAGSVVLEPVAMGVGEPLDVLGEMTGEGESGESGGLVLPARSVLGLGDLGAGVGVESVPLDTVEEDWGGEREWSLDEYLVERVVGGRAFVSNPPRLEELRGGLAVEDGVRVGEALLEGSLVGLWEYECEKRRKMGKRVGARRKRRKRGGKSKGYRLVNADFEMLEFLCRVKLATLQQLMRRFGRNSATSIRRRLRCLRSEGLVESGYTDGRRLVWTPARRGLDTMGFSWRKTPLNNIQNAHTLACTDLVVEYELRALEGVEERGGQPAFAVFTDREIRSRVADPKDPFGKNWQFIRGVQSTHVGPRAGGEPGGGESVGESVGETVGERLELTGLGVVATARGTTVGDALASPGDRSLLLPDGALLLPNGRWVFIEFERGRKNPMVVVRKLRKFVLDPSVERVYYFVSRVASTSIRKAKFQVGEDLGRELAGKISVVDSWKPIENLALLPGERPRMLVGEPLTPDRG